MRHPQKHIEMGIRCSLENFGTFESPDGKKIDIIPLYAISNLFQSPHIIQHTDSRLWAEDMIAEGNDGFRGKVVFEGIDQEIYFKQDAVVEAGNI